MIFTAVLVAPIWAHWEANQNSLDFIVDQIAVVDFKIDDHVWVVSGQGKTNFELLRKRVPQKFFILESFGFQY